MNINRLMEVLEYNPDTGIFICRISRKGAGAGSVAGCVEPSGYRRIMVDYKRYHAHSLAWLFIYGHWPKDQMDHKNGIRDDNRIENLREATCSENGQNRKMNVSSTSGLIGVTFHRRDKKWQACIMINSRSHHLGYFADKHAAHAAYLAAKSKLHIFQPIPRAPLIEASPYV